MRIMGTLAIAIALLGGSWAIERMNAQGNSNNIAILDNCLPGDPAWNPTGGCTLKPHQGDVSAAEFMGLVSSPLANGGLVGHPSWRNEPSHITADQGKTIRVTNEGGRGHTFTKVANFGGGTITDLNSGWTRAPECPASPMNLGPIIVPPGQTAQVTNLATGLHRFQCCIHPWMRATIRVE